MTTSDPIFCECCEAELNPTHAMWLELNMTTGKWSDPNKTTIPADESQGVFPFGSTCARKQLKGTNE